MKTFERAQTAHLAKPGVMEEHIHNVFRLTPVQLQNHLRIMNDLALPGGKISSKARQWLLATAKASGYDVRQAAAKIDEVQSIADPKKRLEAYVKANGAPSRELVDYAVGLAGKYSTHWASDHIERRLEARDAQQAKSGTQPRFEDTQRMRDARHESDAVRRTIEAPLRDKGLIPSKPATLGEAQARARSYADAAANRLESLGEGASLRDTIEANYHADQGLQLIQDSGIRDVSMGSVIENTDAVNFAARSIDG